MEQISDLLITQLYFSDGLIAYLLVFILAAIPLVEILVVIPIAIAVGLDPFLVAISAFVGNLVPVYLIIIGYINIKKLEHKLKSKISCQNISTSKRRQTSLHIGNKYGIPGISIISPIITGTHLATIMALVFGAKISSLVIWMCISLLAWTVLLTVLSYYGVQFIL